MQPKNGRSFVVYEKSLLCFVVSRRSRADGTQGGATKRTLGTQMRQSASLPSIRGRPELGSYPFLDHNLCNVSAVQERLRDAQLQRRREKLCRVEASRVERATQRIKWGGIKADSDARAARRSAALAQQVLETRSRISVQLAIMKSSLREEQAQLQSSPPNKKTGILGLP
jgi:hypothetical protein